MDAAIADFLRRFEAQEKELYAGLQSAVSRLPVPTKVDPKAVSVRAAIEAGMLPNMEDEEARRFTPSERERVSVCVRACVRRHTHTCTTCVYESSGMFIQFIKYIYHGYPFYIELITWISISYPCFAGCCADHTPVSVRGRGF